MATNKWEYFSSRKNQVGMIAAALTTGLFIVFGLIGAAGVIPWLVATTAAYGAGALLTPSREQKALEPSVPTQALIDAEVQEHLTKLHRANVPPPVYNEALALQAAIRFVLSRWDDLNATPASTIGRWPASWKRRSMSSGTRCPACSDGPVGSKPQYRLIGASVAVRSASRSVDWLISPRHSSSSTMFVLIGSFSRFFRGVTGLGEARGYADGAAG